MYTPPPRRAHQHIRYELIRRTPRLIRLTIGSLVGRYIPTYNPASASFVMRLIAMYTPPLAHLTGVVMKG
jgi:hypothetical protein